MTVARAPARGRPRRGHDRPPGRRRVRRPARGRPRPRPRRARRAPPARRARPRRSRSASTASPPAPASASRSPPPGRAAPTTLLRNADVAMYAAKNAGRGRHQVFDDGMHDAAFSRMILVEELRNALERRRAAPRLPAGARPRHRPHRRRRGAAALGPPGPRRRAALRLHPARRGDPADRADRPLGHRARPRARPPSCSACPAPAPGLTVAVNLSPYQLEDPGLVDDVAAAIEDSRHRPGPARARAHRERAHRRPRRRRADALRAQGPRRPPGARRHRHRPLAVELPAQLPGRHPQARPRAHRLPRRRRRPPDRRAARPRPRARAADGRRGHRAARAARRAQAPGLPPGQGFLFARPMGPDELADLLADAPPVSA